jgi:hypothetical protein
MQGQTKNLLVDAMLLFTALELFRARPALPNSVDSMFHKQRPPLAATIDIASFTARSIDLAVLLGIL